MKRVNDLDYNLIRSQRKTLAIYVTSSAEVEVRAPLKMPVKEIEKFLTDKAAWIEQQIAERNKLLQSKQSFNINYGGQTRFMGKLYPVLSREGKSVRFDGEAFYLPPGLSAEVIRNSLIQIYKLLARQVLLHKVKMFSERLQLFPARVSVNSAKTRWGSCSGKKNLNFTWRLIMAEEDLIDYVVVHELSHIKEPNHSPRFWALVGTVLPDYQVLRNRLREFSFRLAEENWEEG